MTSECLSVGLFVYPTRERKKERKRQRKRNKERKREREKEREKERKKERKRERKKERNKEKKKERKKMNKKSYLMNPAVLVESTGERPTKLQKLFRALSTLQISSVEAERTFSSAGLFLPKIRSNLSDGSIDRLVFLWKYFQNKKGK